MAKTVKLFLEKDGAKTTYEFKTSQGGLRQAERRIKRFLREDWQLVDATGTDTHVLALVKKQIPGGGSA